VICLGLKDKLLKKKQKMREQIRKGREISEQQKAERIRKKIKRFEELKPGTRKTMTEGLIMRKKPWQVMREEYRRRKFEREKKYGKR